jgi:hypothetical protein
MNKTQKLVPGPGQYQNLHDLSRNTRPKFGFGTSLRASTADHGARKESSQDGSFHEIGPGSYETNSKFG